MAAQRRGPDGTARIAVSGSYFAEPWANVFWINTVGGVSAPQANFDTVVSNFGEAYYSSFGAELPGTVTIDLAQGTLFQPNETALHSSHIMAHQGAQTGSTASDNAACPVLSWVTNVYWRGGKPRTYLPGLMASFVLNNKQLTTAAQAAFQNTGNSFHTAVNALNAGVITQVQHGFVSFFSGGQERDPSSFFPISGCRVHLRIGTQRGRLGSWLA